MLSASEEFPAEGADSVSTEWVNDQGNNWKSQPHERLDTIRFVVFGEMVY